MVKEKIKNNYCEDSIYTWFKEKVPSNLEVTQVYGIVFSSDGKVLLRLEDNNYKLTGGHPEKMDNSFEDTLKREFMEEVNIELDDIKYLGYLEINEDNKKYAQVRMIARIKKVNELRPDLDNGKIYKRFLADRKNVKKYLNYPELAGNKMIDDAIEMANEVYKFSDGLEERFI